MSQRYFSRPRIKTTPDNYDGFGNKQNDPYSLNNDGVKYAFAFRTKPENPVCRKSKLNVEQVKEIFLSDCPQAEIASHFKISISTVSKIKNRHIFKQITR